MTTATANIAEDVRAVRTGAGIWLRTDHTFIRFTGKDVAEWLQSQTTNDVVAIKPGEGHANALLNRQGRLQAHFTLHRWQDEYWMLVEREQAPHLLSLLESHLFIEDVTIEETGDDVDQVVIQGPKSAAFLASLLPGEPLSFLKIFPGADHGVRPVDLLGFDALAFRESLTGEDGYVLIVERGRGEALFDALVDSGGGFGVRVIAPEAREGLRIEAGIPRFGVDIDTACTISETTLERHAVSYEKGCYLGQEVVARLKTYGSAKQALMGLIFSGAEMPPEGSAIFDGGKRIGRIASTVQSPTLNAGIALAMLDREHRLPGAIINFAADRAAERGGEYSAKVVVVPFYETASGETRARALYEKSLDVFQDDADDTDASAIPLLREAILLHPAFEDAYEVLGVILNRHGRVDEAIAIMKMLSELNPDCMMAHTNLSVFYVAKGMIDDAETEKAKAAVLGIQAASDERRAKEMAERERKRIREEALVRIGMFKDVLEIDPDDPLATFGMGKAYVQLDDHEAAIPHLRRATEVQKDFSAAWLDFGKCLEFTGHREEALAAYRKGIEAASRKGDLMPLREMERRLKLLEK